MVISELTPYIIIILFSIVIFSYLLLFKKLNCLLTRSAVRAVDMALLLCLRLKKEIRDIYIYIEREMLYSSTNSHTYLFITL